MVRLLGGLAITVMTLYCSPRARTGKGRGREGGGLYPELAAYRISEGSSPNVQAEVGRLVALLPIEQARAELARRGLELDEKAVRRIANELGAQMLASRTRDLLRFRRGELPAGKEFAGKRVAVEIDGGRVRVRTVIKKVRVGGKIKRKPFKVEWREPKLLIVFETDEKGRMAKGSRPVIDGTLRGPDALIELVAFHLHRLGGARATVVTFTADGAPWIWARLDWVIAQVGLEPVRVVEVLDWCHAVHHLSLALQAAGLSEERRAAEYGRLRARSRRVGAGMVIEELEALAAGQPEDSAVWREIGYSDPALGGGSAAVRLLPVSGRAAGQRGDREHDPAGDQPAAEGDEHVLGGGECGGGDPAAGGGVVGPVGGAMLEHTREAMAKDRRTDWRLGAAGMPGGVESAGRGGRRIDATINEETI